MAGDPVPARSGLPIDRGAHVALCRLGTSGEGIHSVIQHVTSPWRASAGEEIDWPSTKCTER